jgi:hypothetical protein
LTETRLSETRLSETRLSETRLSECGATRRTQPEEVAGLVKGADRRSALAGASPDRTLEFAIGELHRELAALDDSELDIVTNCEPWTVRRLASHALNNQLLWAGS